MTAWESSGDILNASHCHSHFIEEDTGAQETKWLLPGYMGNEWESEDPDQACLGPVLFNLH